jgi:hypothetical protein
MRTIGVVLCLAAFAAVGSADTLYFSDGSSLSNCDVLRYAGDRLVYRAPTGPEVSRAAVDVVRIETPDAPAFSAGELAFAERRLDDAVDAYARAARTPDERPWLRQRGAMRLLQAAGATRRFDAAVDAFVALARVNPGAARELRPALPEARSTFLDTALGRLGVALRDASLGDAQREPLLLFQLDIAGVRKDVPLTIRTLQHLLLSSNPDERVRAVAGKIVEDRLKSATALLARSDDQAALAQLTPVEALVTEPEQQARALYLLAECRGAAAARSRDAQASARAAVAYLRLVAHFPDAPLAGDAMLKAADLQQAAGDRAGAARLYGQFAAKYPGHAEAGKARDLAARPGTDD